MDSKRIQESEKVLLMEKVRDFQLKEYEILKKSNEELRIIKHNRKNFLIGIKDLIKNKRFNELNNEIDKELNLRDDVKLLSGNSIVDTVLSYHLDIIVKNNIELNTSFIIPSTLNMSPIDLANLVGNLLTNSTEANQKLKQVSRKIDFEMKYYSGKLNLVISNPYEGELNFKNNIPETTKKSKRNNGIRLPTVIEIVKRYSGQIEIETNGEFKVIIDIPNLI